MAAGERKRGLRVHLSLLLALALAAAAWVQPPFVRTAQDYTQEVAASALLAYAALRTINATISTAKEAEVSVPIVGGIAAKPGMVLDPVDETVARISDALFLVMALTAILALGFAPVAVVGAALGAAGFLGLWLAGLFPGLRGIDPVARAAATVGVVLALLLPASFAGGGWIGERATEARLATAYAELRSIGAAAPETPDPPAEDQPWWRFGAGTTAAESERSERWFTSTITEYMARAETILESSLDIIAIYALRLIVLPLIVLGIVLAVLRGVVRTLTGGGRLTPGRARA